MSRRRRRSIKTRMKRSIRKLKLYCIVLGVSFAAAGMLSLATGQLPGMFRSALQGAISSSIDGMGGGDSASRIINNVMNQTSSTDNSKSLSVNNGGGGGGGLGASEANTIRALMQKHADKL